MSDEEARRVAYTDVALRQEITASEGRVIDRIDRLESKLDEKHEPRIRALETSNSEMRGTLRVLQWGGGVLATLLIGLLIAAFNKYL